MANVRLKLIFWWNCDQCKVKVDCPTKLWLKYKNGLLDEEAKQLFALVFLCQNFAGLLHCFVCLFFCLFVCLFACLFVCLFVCWPACLLVCLIGCVGQIPETKRTIFAHMYISPRPNAYFVVLIYRHGDQIWTPALNRKSMFLSRRNNHLCTRGGSRGGARGYIYIYICMYVYIYIYMYRT